MEEFKKQNFAKTYPDLDFPSITKLTADRVNFLRKCLAKRLDVSSDIDGLGLVRKLDSTEISLEHVNALEPKFSITEILNIHHVEFDDSVILNWHRFDDLDEIKLKDLDEFLSDIWYPASDDIDVFDNSMTWVLSIAHTGKVKFIRLQAH